MGEKGRRNGSFAVVGGGSEEVREMRNGLMLAPVGQMASGPGLLPGAMSASVILQQPGCLLMSMTSVITEGCVDDQGLARHLRPCWCPRSTLPPGPCKFGWPALPPGTMDISGPGLILMTMSGSYHS